MSGVDVRMVMESDAHCARESRERHYSAELVEAASANSAAASAAVSDLIAAGEALEQALPSIPASLAVYAHREELLAFRDALAACKAVKP